MLVWFRDTFGNIRVYIPENGAAFYDPPQPGPDGIDDPLRCDYLSTHIAAIGDANARGVHVLGYMIWSQLDNAEWTLGFYKRLRIVRDDFYNPFMTPKTSATIFTQNTHTHPGH